MHSFKTHTLVHHVRLLLWTLLSPLLSLFQADRTFLSFILLLCCLPSTPLSCRCFSLKQSLHAGCPPAVSVSASVHFFPPCYVLVNTLNFSTSSPTSGEVCCSCTVLVFEGLCSAKLMISHLHESPQPTVTPFTPCSGNNLCKKTNVVWTLPAKLH